MVLCLFLHLIMSNLGGASHCYKIFIPQWTSEPGVIFKMLLAAHNMGRCIGMLFELCKQPFKFPYSSRLCFPRVIDTVPQLNIIEIIITVAFIISMKVYTCCRYAKL